MKLHLVVISSLCAALAACHGGGFELPQAGLKYSQSTDLNFVTTNGELSRMKSNDVSFRGSDEIHAYNITYKFNSGNNTSFKLIESHQAAPDAGSCDIAENIVLKDGNSTHEISLLEASTLEPNTDYTLEVVLTPSCDNIDVTFGLTAWLGDSKVNPELAYICKGKTVPEITFFPKVNAVVGFIGRIGQEKFLSSDSYCGEGFSGKKVDCSVGSTPLSHSECTAASGDEKRHSEINLDPANATASVSCDANGKDTFNEKFDNCRKAIVDFTPYNRFLGIPTK